MEEREASSFPLAVGLQAARDTARRYLLKQISVTISWMPVVNARCRGPLLTAFFRSATFCGEEEFYFVAVPVYMWFFDAGNGIALVLLFAFNLYLGNWLKNWFRLPRPPLQMRSDWTALAARAAAGGAAGDAGAPAPSSHAEGASCTAAAAASACAFKLADAPAGGPRGVAASMGGGVGRDGGSAGAGAAKQTEGVPAADIALSACGAEEAAPGAGAGESSAAVKDVDFGWPSTHSMNAVALPFYLLRCAFPIAVWDYAEPATMWGCGLLATLWALAVSASRVYLGVHSPADVQGGMMLGAIVLRLWLLFHRALSAWVVCGFGGARAPGGTAEGGGASGLCAGQSGGPAAADPDVLLLCAVGAALLIGGHPVLSGAAGRRTATFMESVMVVGFGFGFVVGAHLSGGNGGAAVAPEHLALPNVLACLAVGGGLVALAKRGSRELAGALLRYGPTRRLAHALLAMLPLSVFLRALALVDVPTNMGVLFVAMCAAVYFLEGGSEGSERKGSDSEGAAAESADGADCGAARGAARGAFGSDSADAVIAKFANYASCGLTLTLAVPAAFRQLGLR